MNIPQEHLAELNQICGLCKKFNKCKDHNRLCFGKIKTYQLAKLVYKRRVKKGLIKDDCS